MGRRSGAMARMHAAIDLLERYGTESLDVDKVLANVDLTWDEAQGVVASKKRDLARQALRERGYVITDADTRVRKDFWQCTPTELAAQLQIKKDSSDYDRARLVADEAVLTFLRVKENELGYEPYPGLFQADISRIYSMHGLTAPKQVKAAA